VRSIGEDVRMITKDSARHTCSNLHDYRRESFCAVRNVALEPKALSQSLCTPAGHWRGKVLIFDSIFPVPLLLTL